VAVIGLGHMGRAMARRLVGAGYRVRVWNRTPPEAIDGAAICPSIARAVAGATFVITSLADDTAVKEVALGPGGVLESMDDHATHVGTSTISHGLATTIAEAHAARGRTFIAAPVLGRPE